MKTVLNIGLNIGLNIAREAIISQVGSAIKSVIGQSLPEISGKDLIAPAQVLIKQRVSVLPPLWRKEPNASTSSEFNFLNLDSYGSVTNESFIPTPFPLSPKREPVITGHTLIRKMLINKISETWLVRNNQNQKEYAIKILNSYRANKPEEIQLLLREARNHKKLIPHPNIVKFHGVSLTPPLIATECNAIGDVKYSMNLEHKRVLSIKPALPWILDWATGLAHCHQSGILHGDIKSKNLTITHDGVGQLLDFGNSWDTAIGPLKNGWYSTRTYMAPEQFKSEVRSPKLNDQMATSWPVDLYSDVFSFGTTLYLLLTGRNPDHGIFDSTPNDNIDASLTLLVGSFKKVPTHPCHINPSIPEELAKIILKCLKASPGDRYQNGIELLKDLKAFSRKS